MKKALLLLTFIFTINYLPSSYAYKDMHQLITLRQMELITDNNQNEPEPVDHGPFIRRTIERAALYSMLLAFLLLYVDQYNSSN